MSVLEEESLGSREIFEVLLFSFLGEEVREDFLVGLRVGILLGDDFRLVFVLDVCSRPVRRLIWLLGILIRSWYEVNSRFGILAMMGICFFFM